MESELFDYSRGKKKGGEETNLLAARYLSFADKPVD